MNFDRTRVELAEVFWGDKSRVQKGIPGIIFGLFQILFGLRYVAYVAADQQSPATDRLQWLGLISSRILHGPVLAVCYLLALLSFALMGTQLLWDQSYRGLLWTACIICLVCTVGLITSMIGTRITRSRVIKRFWFWVRVTTVFVAGLLVIKITLLQALFPDLQLGHEVRPGLIWYCRILVIQLGFLWLVEIVVILSMAACTIVAGANRRIYRPALIIAFLLPAFAVGAWSQALPLTWVSAREGIDFLTHIDEFVAVFDEAIPLLGVQFLMMLVITTTAVASVFRYFWWRSKLTDSNSAAEANAPRLIVHPSLKFALAAATGIGVSLVLYLGVQQFRGYDYLQLPVGKFMAEANKYVAVLLVPLGGMIFFLLPRLRPVLDIVLDVTNHFYFRATRIQDALDDDDEFDIKETTFESGALYFSRRDAIIARLKRVLVHYRDEIGSRRPTLTIVAHSQGTMYAIEALNDPELSWIKNAYSSTTLVTMGSPFKHLYQYYFGHIYPALEHPFWSSLRKQTDRWINIYRVDDFVGRQIEFPRSGWCETESLARGLDTTTVNPKCQYQNFRIGPRGHMSYWTDREAIDILRHQLLDDDAATTERRAA